MHGVFVHDVRISTIATACCFGLLGLFRGGDMRAFVACAAWLTGFETVYQVTDLLVGGTETYPSAVPLLLLPGLIVVPLAWGRYKVRPSLPLLAATGAVWVVWIATGFHENEPAIHVFSVSAEVLNVGAKTLLALAYAWPLLTRVPRFPVAIRSS